MAKLDCFDDLVHMDDVEVGTGVTFILLTPLALIPPYLKLRKEKTSKGYSYSTLLLLNVNYLTSVASCALTKAKQFEKCFSEGWWKCQPSMLMLYVLIITAVVNVPLFYFTTIVYPPNEQDKSNWYLKNAVPLLWLQFFYGFFLLCVVLGFQFLAPCSELSLIFATAFGILVSAVTTVQWFPQMISSWQNNGAGSISYISYSVQAIGGLLVMGFMIFASHERVETWLPMLIGNIGQLSVLVICVYYDFWMGCWPRKHSSVENESDLSTNLITPRGAEEHFT